MIPDNVSELGIRLEAIDDSPDGVGMSHLRGARIGQGDKDPADDQSEDRGGHGGDHGAHSIRCTLPVLEAETPLQTSCEATRNERSKGLPLH